MYIKYLKSLMLHKWYVFLAGLKTGVPVWRLIVHDWSKFSFSEFGPYARYFFGDYPSWENDRLAIRFPTYSGKTKESVALDFDYAWLNHQNKNPHHWQYWILVYDDDPKVSSALPMPETYVREMVADWMGASKTYTGDWNMSEWLAKSGMNLDSHMHRETVDMVWGVLEEIGYFPTDGEGWAFMMGKQS